MMEKLVGRIKTYSVYLIILLVLIFAVSLIRNILKIYSAQNSIEKTRQRVEALKKENDALQKRLDEARSQENIEKQIREKLGLAKEGEIVVVLPDAETLRKLAPKVLEEEESLPDPTWRKWIKLFI